MNLNPIVLSIPIFFLLIGTELLVERFTHQRLYRLPDAISNISCGITSEFSGLFLKIFGIGIYQLLFEKFALFTPDSTNWWKWVKWAKWLRIFAYPVLLSMLTIALTGNCGTMGWRLSISNFGHLVL